MDHLAILDKRRKLLAKIVSGEKSIESRWYKTRKTPYKNINKGDIIYFKDSGEPVTAKAEVDKVLFFDDLNEERARHILKSYARQICIKPDYDEKYLKYRYITLIFLKNVESIKSFGIDKRGFGNAAAWITVDDIDELKTK